jgi:hypothetical protein
MRGLSWHMEPERDNAYPSCPLADDHLSNEPTTYHAMVAMMVLNCDFDVATRLFRFADFSADTCIFVNGAFLGRRSEAQQRTPCLAAPGQNAARALETPSARSIRGRFGRTD